MNSKECEALARTLAERINEHDLDKYVELYSDDSETVTVATGERLIGKEGARKDGQRWLTAFPDLKFDIVELHTGEDFAVIELRVRGTHEGPLSLPDGDIPATGKAMDGRGCFLLRMKDGAIVSEHDYFDRLTLMEQLGLAGEARPMVAAEERPTP